MSFGFLSGFAFGGALHCFTEARWYETCALLATSILTLLMGSQFNQPKVKKETP